MNRKETLRRAFDELKESTLDRNDKPYSTSAMVEVYVGELNTILDFVEPLIKMLPVDGAQ